MKTFANIQKEIISHLKSSAMSAQCQLCSLGLVVTLLLLGTGNVWGATVTQTYTLSADDNGDEVTTGDVSWNIGNNAIVASSSNMKLTGTITVTLPTGATLESVSLTKSNNWGSGATVTLYAGSTSLNAFSGPGSFTLSSNKTNGTYKFTKTGTSSKNAWVKTISVTYTPAAATATLTLKLPKGDGTFVDYETTDKSKLANYSLMVSEKTCSGDADFWGGSWNSGYWTDAFIDYDDATTTQPTRYNSSSTFSTDKTLWPLFVYGSTPTYYHTDPYCPTYHVTYNGNGKTSGTVPSDATDYDGGETVTVKSATLTKTNYTFTGWNTESDGSGTHYAASGSATFTITEDVTLYAEWCRDLSTLVKDDDFLAEANSISGTGATLEWVADDATYYQIAVADNSVWASATYQFMDASAAYNSKTFDDLTPNTTYYVQVRAKNGCGSTYKDYTFTFTTLAAYVITYYKNDGSATSATESKTQGVNYTISSNKFSRDGYTLSRWNTQAGGGGTDYAKGATYSTDAALTLYAVWTANNYTITLDKNGGYGGPASVSATYGAAAPSVGTLPTKADKNFAGYWTGSGGTGTMVVDASGVWVASISGYTDGSKNWIGTSGKTIYAKWVDKTYINYRTTCEDPKTLDYITIDTDPTKLIYLVGETVNTAGAVVTAHYTDDTTSDVTASVTWTAPSGALSAGLDQALTASYTLGGVTKTATHNVIDVYAVTLLKKDETGASISGELSDAPAVSLTSVNHLTAAETGAKYTFKEWQVTNGTLSSTSALTPTIDAVSGAITVTAVYYKPITVTWHVPSGVYSGPSTYSRGWSAILPASNPDPEDYGCDGKVFYGWSRTSDYSSDDTAPTDIVASGESLTSDEDFYAVFAIQDGSGAPPTWQVTAFGSVTAGKYLIACSNKKVFNGTISSGHGQVTSTAFTSALSGSFSEYAPEGACELTLSANSSGWNMYNATYGYLYCTGSSSGNLAWNASEQDYWYNNSSSWRYHGAKNGSGVYVALSDYGTSIRTYTSPTNIVLLKQIVAGSPATYSDFSTSCTCKGFSFHTSSESTDADVKTTNTRTCFVQEGSSTTWKIENYTIPSDTKFFVGYQDLFKSSGLGTSSRSAIKSFNADESLYFEYTKTYGDGYRPSVGNAVGAIGTLRIWSDNNWDNCHVGFDPNGYIFKLGSNYYTMSNSATLDGNQYKETEIITLTSTDISGKYQVNIAAVAPNASTGVASRYTENKNLAGMGVKSGSSTWRGEGIKASDANTKGFFRIDKGNGGATNWNAHWVPCYELTFDLKGGTGTIVTTPEYVSVEAASKVVTIPTTVPTKSGYRFMGWSNTDGGAVSYAAGSTHNVTLSGNKTVYAVWAQEYTVTYDANGGTTSCSEPTHIAGETVTVCATEPTRDCSTFLGWSGDNGIGTKAASATFTMPAANVTMTAQWNTTQYAITYKDKGDVTYTGSNIGSLPANHTCGSATVLPNGVKEGYRFDGWFTASACTGDPITSIASDAVGPFTLYAKWTASLTFTFSKNGVVDGTLTLGQVEGGNVIMPNTTVDCGLWTTFEGWVIGDIAETTTEPTTIYKPGDIFVAGNSNQEFKAVYSKHEGDATVSYHKVTSGLRSGTYIMVSSEVASNKYVYTGQNSGSGTTDYGTVTTVTESDGVVTSANLPSGAKEITVRVGRNGSFNNKFAMQIPSTKYLSATSGNYLNSDIASGDVADAYVWKLDNGTDSYGAAGKEKTGAAGALRSTEQTTRVIQYNSSRFACYTNSQANYVFLYRKRIAGTTYYTTAPGSCDVPTEITVSYNDNKAYAGDQTISGMPSGTTLTFTSYPNFASYSVGAAPTDPTGYHFTGWNTSADGGGDAYTAGGSVTTFGYTETITLYAQWERVYSVTLYDNGVERETLVEASAGAGVTLPSGNNCTPSSDFTFVGWTESAIQLNADPVRPAAATLHVAGSYTPTSDITLYSVYSRSVAGCEDFAAGKSGAYKLTNKGSSDYAKVTANEHRYDKGSTGDAEIFYIAYSAAKSAYTIRTSLGYLGWSGSVGDEELTKNNATPYYWDIKEGSSGNAGYWNFQPKGASTKQFSGNGTYFQLHSNSTKYYIQLTKNAMTYYYNTAICEGSQITFHTGGGTISGTPTTPDGASWNSGTHVLSGLEDCDKITEFPTANYDGWTFIGWSTEDYSNSGKHSTDYVDENGSTDDPDASSIYNTGKNAYIVMGGNVTLYPVFTRFPSNDPFDTDAGGDYVMYYVDGDSDDGYGAPVVVYAGDFESDNYQKTSNCASATVFTFSKDGDVWHIYDKTKMKYVAGANSDNALVLRSDLSGDYDDWTIAIKNGNQFEASCQGGRRLLRFSTVHDNFKDYDDGGNASLYPPVYLGTCTERIYSSEPSPAATLDLDGSPTVTSSAGQTIRATVPLLLSGAHLGNATTVTLSGTNLKFATSVTATPAANLEVSVTSGSIGATNIYVYYTPIATEDGIENITVTATANNTAETTKRATVTARHLPANFVIAAKASNGKWYALPADITGSTSPTNGVLIEVDNNDDPTTATSAPNNVQWGLRNVKATRQTTNGLGHHLTFTERLSTATADNQKTLYNGSTTSIQAYAMWSGYATTNPEQYEWMPTTTDLKDYTLTSAKTFDGDAAARTLSMNTSGVFGSLLQAKAYDGKVRLLPAEFYTNAAAQVVEWKANSVVVMYTGTQTTAKTKVGTNSASSAQTLSEQMLTHAIYELTTGQSLASNDGKKLEITFGTTEKLIVEIPVIITGTSTASDNHASQDLIILKNAKLTAATTKYSYRNVYVYGGGKLDIPDGTSLGVNNIILRAGGISTNGSGGSATYEYIYPQVKLVGELTSSVPNIKYEYVTDYTHWYHLCLPFDASYTSVSYPQEYYGSNVAADNHGSWVIKRYDGAKRATGDYDAWVDIETDWKKEGDPKIVYAGHGYIFWGAPKKVSVGGGTATRQAWGIQRMTMAIAAGDAKTAENANKTVSDLEAYSAETGGINDQGWNLIGNPYMVNLTGLSSESIKTGNLVKEMVGGQWTGKWITGNASDTRYITIPDNNFETYEAQPTSYFDGSTLEKSLIAGRTFFVQLADEATAVEFDVSKRASLAPAWHRNTEAEQTVDVETGIVMSSETLADEVNFWIKDGKTEAYEFNADYPKTPNKTNFNIYGVHQSGNLSWVAISPEIAEGDMAIGYQVPAAGDYVLSLSEKYIADDIESVYVTDHGVSPELTTDLMVNTYSFTVHQAETNNERFTVSIKVREEDNTATDIGNSTVDTHAVKFIRDDKMYILRNNVIYDSTGKRVNVINK